MGFFSWYTQDTDKSISNCHSPRKTFTVYMKDNKGRIWKEESYQGYGMFGGKDYFELVAEMNTGKKPNKDRVEMDGYDDDLRSKGIDLWAEVLDALCDDLEPPSYIFPSLSESPDFEWTGELPIDCPDQGFFYES